MRWNPSNPGTHQYATDIHWATVNAQTIKGFTIKLVKLVNTTKFQNINNY